uniref:Uncharacterized protein n=1 Tax=viral metagenome TaxID=1070528 RepID=A0A6C0JVP4_9ZZZZ
MAAFTEIYIEQYSDFSTILNVLDTQGDYLDLSGYSAESQIRQSYYSETYSSFNVSITDASTGEITLSLTSANTANLEAGRQQFDLIITSPANNITRVIEGVAIVLPGVTHG